MNKIKLVVDASSDISREIADEYNIERIPISITIEDAEYTDKGDINLDEFYEKLLNAKELAHTSQVTPFVFKEIFENLIKDYDEILYISISSKGSGMYQNAVLMADEVMEENPGKRIVVLDSKGFTGTYQYPAIMAAKVIKNGGTLDEAIAECEKYIDKMELVFSVSDLDFLYKGGRLNKATLVFGNMLDIRPILSVRDGMIAAINKFRGSKKIPKKLIKYIQERNNVAEDSEFIVEYGSNPEDGEELAQLIRDEFGKEPIVFRFGPTISVHAGPNSLGVIYFATGNREG